MILQRASLGTGGAPTLGTLTSKDGAFTCVTLERSVDGEHPAIPAGTYPVVMDTHHPGTPGAYLCPELRDVPGRSEIQIHIANTPSELRGCIATGEKIADGGHAIEASRHAFERLMAYLASVATFTLEVVDP